MGRKSRRPRGAARGRSRGAGRDLSRDLPRDPASLLGVRIEEGPSWDFGRPYQVRVMSAAAAQKVYLCPGCQLEIRPRHGHIVAWPRDYPEDRRHWHHECWQRR